MKQILILFITILFVSCQQNNQDSNSIDKLKIESALENPCIECTQKIQTELALCLKNAGSDQEKIRQCNSKASTDWVNKCKALCNPRIETINEQAKGSGACKKCTCPSFREDATSGTCLNIRVPSTILCRHTASEHK